MKHKIIKVKMFLITKKMLTPEKLCEHHVKFLIWLIERSKFCE